MGDLSPKCPMKLYNYFLEACSATCPVPLSPFISNYLLYLMSSSKPGEDNISCCFTDTHGVITTTINNFPGYRITKALGTVYGATVKTRNWGADLTAIVRFTVGGELRSFTTLMYRARNEAVERLVDECMGRGGNTVVAMRFDIARFGACVQVCAYGTACFAERDGEGKAERGGGDANAQ